MDEPDCEELPCGCYGRCICRRLDYLGFAIAAILSGPIVLLLGVVSGSAEWPGGLARVALGALFFEFYLCVTVTVIASLTAGRQVVRTLWGLAKFFAGMGLGTVTGIGIAAVVLRLSQSRVP